MQENGNESHPRPLRVLLALTALATIGFSTDPCGAQTTYIWNVSGGAAAWGTAANWSPARTTPAANDILVFDGSVTPTCTPNQLVTQSMGKLILTNNAHVSLLASAGAATLTIAGGTGVDFEVQAGCALSVAGSTITTQLGAAATGLVTGDIHLPGGSHRFLATGTNSLVFGSGGRISAEPGFTGSVFGTTALNTVDFLSGSEYVSIAGADPFGAAAPQSVVTFEAGSRYTHQQTAAPSLSGRTYADFQLNASAYNQISTGTQPFIVDDLTITIGQMHLRLTDIRIRGDVYVAGGAMLDFNPTAAQTVRFNGLAAQTVANIGIMMFNSFSDVLFQNLSGVTLSLLVAFSGTTTVDPGARLITQSLVTNSGTMNVNGTYQLETGGSASGNNFIYAPAATLVFNNGATTSYSGQPYWAGSSPPRNVVVQGGGNVSVGAPPPVILGVLTLSNGILSSDSSNPIIIGQGGVVSGGSAASHINGYLKKYFAASGAPSTTVFEIGDPSRYTPVSLELPSVTAGGYVLASTTATDPANIGTSGLDPFRSVNRTWDLANVSATIPPASITFTFDPTDLDPGTDPSSFDIRTFNPPNIWTTQTVGTRTATSTQVTGVTTLGAFAIANRFWVIEVSHGPNGGIFPNQTVYVSNGYDQHFDITADPCFAVEDVLVDSVSVGPVTEYTFVDVTQDHTISATFVPDSSSTITASAGTGGSIGPNGAVSVACDADTTFTIAPDACHTIANVDVDGSSVGAVADYTFTNVTTSHTISASFAPIPKTITASAGSNGSISPSGAVSVDCGDDETFTITPDPFYATADVIVDGSSVGAVASYTFIGVTADHTISASFAPVSGQCCGRWSFVHGTFGDSKYRAAEVYDPDNDRMIIHGGNGVFPDVWAVSLSSPYTWTELSPAGPGPGGRVEHAAIFDPVARRMVEFGGWDVHPTTTFNDVWALSLAGIPSWTNLTPGSGPAPSPRRSHSAVYDVPNHRIIVFGGTDATGAFLNDVWSLSLTGTPAWTQITPAGTAPSPRQKHSAIYDPVGLRMIVFGGDAGGGSWTNDVWELSLTGSAVWTDITPQPQSGFVAPPMSGHKAFYDPSGQQMVVYGGGHDFWMLSLTGTPEWTKATPGGSHFLRTGFMAVYDPSSSSVFISSGVGGGLAKRSGDLWEVAVSGSPTWIDHTPINARDLRRRFPSVVYDPVGRRMVIHGGESESLTPDQVWSLSLDGIPAWTDMTPTNGPGPQGLYASAIYDPDGERMIVFGGEYAGVDTWRNDVWALSLTGTPEWTNITPSSGPAPDGRVAPALVYDSIGHRMLMYGGSHYSPSFNDVWALSLTGTPEWTNLTPAGPSPPARQACGAVYEPISQRMIVFGGDTYFELLDDVWALSLSGTPTWTNITPAGVAPAARASLSAILDPAGGSPRMIVYGGATALGSTPATGDVWALSLTGTPAWSDITPPAFGPTPRPRFGHAAIYDPYTESMVIYAGWTLMHSNTVWSLCLNQGVYTITATAGDGGSISPPGVTTVPPDCGQTYTITPEYGYMIAEVFVDGIPQGALSTYTFSDIQGNHMIHAVFAPNVSSVPDDVPTTLRLEGVRVISSGAAGIKVTFVLPSETPARLELMDVTGRRIAEQEVVSQGAGRKTVDLTGRRLPASGIYWLRLVQGRETRVAKVFIVR